MIEIIGYSLAGILILFSIQSTIFFLGIKKTKILEWLFFNPCAISCLLFSSGFIFRILFKDSTIIFVSILPMFYFGTLSLFFLPWKKLTIIPQFHHIIMTISIAWVIYVIINTDFKMSFIGLVIVLIPVLLFIKIHEFYIKINENEFIKKMQ